MVGLLINMKILGNDSPKISGKFPNEITKIAIPDGPLGLLIEIITQQKPYIYINLNQP